MLNRTAFAIALLLVVGTAQADTHLVELFTSEGCSSCPPADVVLGAISKRDDVAVLSWHVDYWDYIGWTDPFGHEQATPRQRAYAQAFRSASIYTPQMVVNGRIEFVGSDRARAERALNKVSNGSAKIELSTACDTKSASVKVSVEGGNKSGRVFLAITEDNLASNVERGENRGRALHHDGVVRRVIGLGRLRNGAIRAEHDIKLVPEWKRDDLKVVVWVQDMTTMSVHGAASASLVAK